MDTREAYQELGVYPNVSDVELKAIWRRLVAAWHPDRNATVDASRRMQHINKAYQHIRQLRDGQSASTDDGGHAETQAGQPKASDSPEPEEHTRRGSAGIHVISGKKCLKPMFLNGFLELLSQRTATAPVARHLAEPDRNHRHRIAAKLHR